MNLKLYELTYLFDKNLNSEEQKALSEKVIGFLPNPPTRKEDGFSSSTLEFYSQPEKIEEIGKNLKAENQITRFMFLVKKLTKPESRIRRRLPKEPTIQPVKTEKKVELKEIGEKLDEILGK